MINVEEIEGKVKIPRNFDLEEFSDQSFGVFHGEEPLTVEWRFDPSASEEAKKFQFHPLQKTEDLEDGSLLVKFTATGSVEMCWELFTWGNNVEIIAPQRLRETYANLLERSNEVAENYYENETQIEEN